MTQTLTERLAGSKALAFGLVLALMVAGLLLTSRPAHADTFAVNSTGDAEDVDPGDGVCAVNDIPGFAGCTLRAAIQEANATEGADTISFNIGGGSGLKTIRSESELPDITKPLTIDGYTQPGASENTQEIGTDAVLKVELNGADATGQASGLTIKTSDSVVRGLVINRFDFNGISMFGSAKVKNNKIEGNFIGTDPSGTQDLGNERDGVFENGGGRNTIGGASPAARNLISGNGRGMDIFGKGSNKIQGNLIGTKKDGATALGNDNEGVQIAGSSNNAIGGAEQPGAANTIAFNIRGGVRVASLPGEEATSNRILNNSIFSNGLLGIDLAGDGPTANDPKDPDKGPNNLQNFPVLTSATASGGATAIEGTLNSTPSKGKKKRKFTVQLFSMPSGEDEGKTFLGQKTVKTDKQGKASFAFTTEAEVSAGEAVTATATDSKGNTSEFSAPVEAA